MKKVIKRILLALLCMILLAVGYVGVRYALPGYRIYRQAVAERPVETAFEEIKNQEHYVTIDELPPYYKEAVVSVEDHRYYQHGAFSVWSILRAIATNIRRGDLVEGGSTITQQVAKNLYFGMERSLTRKFSELFLSVELERRFSKDEILEVYINSIYYGSGYYCLYDAAMGYYGVAPSDLTPHQATLLAGLPNAPSVYSPDNNTPLTAQRHRQVLDSMVSYGKLTAEEADEIFNAE